MALLTIREQGLVVLSPFNLTSLCRHQEYCVYFMFYFLVVRLKLNQCQSDAGSRQTCQVIG